MIRFLITCLLSFMWLLTAEHAFASITLPYPLPYTHNGVTYTDVFATESYNTSYGHNVYAYAYYNNPTGVNKFGFNWGISYGAFSPNLIDLLQIYCDQNNANCSSQYYNQLTVGSGVDAPISWTNEYLITTQPFMWYNSYSNLPGIGDVAQGTYFAANYTSFTTTLPFISGLLTYTQKVVGFGFDGTYQGYERELYTPADSGIRIYHTGPDPHGDFLATGMFTGNASETISAHEGIIESLLPRDHIRLNETKNCFATIKSNVDIRWTTNYAQYGDLDNCGYYHEEGDLVVPKNLNTDGTGPINACISPSYCAFPDFANVSANIRDRYNVSDYVHIMDVFDGVPSYLNSKSTGTGYDSYYQCTEYVARYLHSKFDTDYTDKKNVGDIDTQGFRGYDFHPNYGGNPTVDKGGQTVSLASASPLKIGDIAMFSSRHAAIVKLVSGTTATLAEQNYIINNQYTTNRTIDTSTVGITFYRYPAAVVDGTNEVSSTIQDAYDSMPTGNQTIKMQTQTFNENLNFSRDVSVTLLGGYDPNFQATNGMTIIFGSLTISSGTLVADNICIQ